MQKHTAYTVDYYGTQDAQDKIITFQSPVDALRYLFSLCQGHECQSQPGAKVKEGYYACDLMFDDFAFTIDITIAD